MATYQLPLGNFHFYDGNITPSTLQARLSVSNAKYAPCYLIYSPNGADCVLETIFTVPQNYAGSPVLVIKGVLESSPANILAFGCQQIGRLDSETVDIAYETEDLVNISSWTGYSGADILVTSITITPSAAYAPGETVILKFFRDDSVDTSTFNFLLTELLFQYSDT